MKKAMSMIELIVSIVVMGIVATGVPMLVQRSQGGSVLDVVRQENILAAKTQLWRILSYEWDANSFSPTDQVSYILRTGSALTALNTRAGLTGLSGRRAYSPIAGINASTIMNHSGGSLANVRAIEGFNNLEVELDTSSRIGGTLQDASDFDYLIKSSAATPTIEYFNDNLGANIFDGTDINITIDPTSTQVATSNVKLISVRVDTEVDVDGDSQNEFVVMRGFASNIGQSLSIDPRELP